MKEGPMMKNNKLIKDFMTDNDIDRERLARILNVSVSAVNSWHCGARQPSSAVIGHITTLNVLATIAPDILDSLLV